MADVLFIYPKEEAPIFPPMIPLGLAWMAAFLEDKGYSAQILDCAVEDTAVGEAVRRCQPAIVGIGGTTITRFESFRIASLVKQVDPSITVVYGGCHATFTAEDTLSHIRDIDIIARGEGELTILELVKKVTSGGKQGWNEILGISYREDGAIRHNSPRPWIQDLDSIPMPAYHLLDMGKYRMDLPFLNIPAGSVITSRGCPIGCVFCAASALWGESYRMRSASKVADEIEILIGDYGIQGVKFFDSTLTLQKRHVLNLCEEFLRRGLNFPWECEVRANTVDFELLKKMKEAGCYYIDLGVESASPRVLKAISKKITIEQVENTINWARQLDLLIKCFFMTGLPGETLEDGMMTVEFMKRHGDKMSPAPGMVLCTIYPGTYVETFARENGCLPSGFSWSEPFYDPNYSVFHRRAPPHVPILFQKQLGPLEMWKLQHRMETMAGLFKPDRLLQRLSSFRSIDDLKRFLGFGWDLLKWKLRRFPFLSQSQGKGSRYD